MMDGLVPRVLLQSVLRGVPLVTPHALYLVDATVAPNGRGFCATNAVLPGAASTAASQCACKAAVEGACLQGSAFVTSGIQDLTAIYPSAFLRLILALTSVAFLM